MTEEERVLAAMDRSGQDVGIYRKYVVSRVDGSSNVGGKHARCAYFVLDWQHDPFAVPAARAYADACEDKFPALADDLRQNAELHATRWALAEKDASRDPWPHR